MALILYTNWAASRAQPSNSSHPDDGRTQNHAWIHPHFSGEWDDYWNDIQGGLGLLPTSGIAEIPLSYFSISDATFREGKGGDVTITRTGGTTTSQKLKIVSSDGSATLSNDDYAQANKTVTFAAGETSKTINISTTADLNVENDESFTLTMTAEGSDEVPPQITDGLATVTIKADDFKRDNSLYTIVDGKTWNEVQTEAEKLGGHLATVRNSSENSFLSSKFKDLAKTSDPNWGGRDRSETWIGLHFKNNNGFVWDDGTDLNGDYFPHSNTIGHDSPIPNLIPTGGGAFYLILEDPSGHAQRHGGLEKWLQGPINPHQHYGLADSVYLGTQTGIAEIPIGGTPTYSISPSTSSIDEKSESSVRFNISTTNVDTNTRLYYTLSGSNINSADFSSGDIKSSRLIGSDGKATFVLSAAADKTTEGSESFNIKLYSDFQRTNLVATSSSVSIADTSKTPVKTPTYSLSLSPSAIDEGDSFRASIATTNLNAGTRLYYSIKGGVNSSDFSSSLTGSVAINANGNASVTRKALADKLTEGPETARILFYSDQQRTLQVGNTASLSIRDTSTTPKKSTHNISFNRSSIKEGEILTSTITTKNIDPGTRLYWNLSGTGVNTSDFSSGSLKGSSAIDKSGEFTLTHALAEDKTTEGTEQLTFKLFSDSSRNTLLTQKKIDIADTSKAKQSAALLSASVNANTISLNFDSSLDNTKPNHNRFSITADGTSIDISSSSLNADAGTLKLNLASAIKPNQSVKLTYTDLKGDQSDGVLQTPNGTDLSSFSTAVSNKSLDSTAPTVTAATINGKVLSLSFDEVIAKATPSNRSWILKEDGKAISITSASVDSNSAQLDLTLATAVDRGSNITLSYSDISGDQKANVIQDLSGNDLASFSNFSVENQTTRSSDPLDLNTAEINGNEVVLAFSRELSTTTPSTGTFRLRANNKAIKVNSITLFPNDREAVLKIASPVAHGDNVTLSYTDAQGNQKSNVIEDVDGNDLATVNNLKLSNNTRKSATDFEVDYADADGKIINVYLTDSLSSSIPKASLFRVTADKRKQKISSVSTSESDGIITLNLKKSINPKQDILISYRDLKGNQRSGIAEDTDGNDLASFKNLSPINDTSSFDEITDNNPPALEDAYLDGTELVLEFDKILQTGKVSPSRFKLRAGRTRVRVASALVPQDDNSTAIVTLKYPLAASANSLTIAYKDLRGDQSSFVIQDDSGNDLASLRNFDVEIIGADFLA